MKTTCTPYDGKLSEKQQGELLDVFWDYMKRDPGYDRVKTGWGTKTKTGLLYVIERIVLDKEEA